MVQMIDKNAGVLCLQIVKTLHQYWFIIYDIEDTTSIILYCASKMIFSQTRNKYA